MNKHYQQAKDEGRICRNCLNAISKASWSQKHIRESGLCGNCYSAFQGVNVSSGADPISMNEGRGISFRSDFRRPVHVSPNEPPHGAELPGEESHLAKRLEEQRRRIK